MHLPTLASPRLLACSLALGAALSISAVAPAQVWPAGFDNKAGTAGQASPFSVGAASLNREWSRAITVFAQQHLPFAKGHLLRSIAFRRDASKGDYAAYRATQLLVRIGTVRDAASPVSNTQFLWEGAPSTVFDAAYSIPAASDPKGRVPNFDLVIPFQAPWRYQGGDLCIDVAVRAPAARVWRREATLLGSERPAALRNLGRSCATSTDRELLLWIDRAAAIPGGLLRAQLEGPARGRSTVALAIFGAPLPVGVPLDGAGLRASCKLYVDPLLSLLSPLRHRSTLSERMFLEIPLPNDASLAGAKISQQCFVDDSGLTSRTPLAASNALEITLGAALDSTRVPFVGRSLWRHEGRRPEDNDGLVAGPDNYVPILRFN